MPPKRDRGRGRASGGADRRDDRAEQRQHYAGGRDGGQRRDEGRFQDRRTRHEPREPPAARAAGRAPAEVYRPPAARGAQRMTEFEPGPDFVRRQEPRQTQQQQPRQQPTEPGRPTQRQPPPEQPRESRAQPTEAARARDTQAAAAVAGLSLETREPPLRFDLARRPGYGTLGIPISLIANYFLLTYKDTSVYHYDVDIIFKRQRRRDQQPLSAAATGRSVLGDGKTKKEALDTGVSHVEHQVKRAPGKERCRQVIAELIRSKALKQFNPVYDSQKNIYTTKPFPIKKKTSFALNLEEDDRVAEFEVVIQPVEKEGGGNIISLEPLFQLYDGRSKEVPQEVLMVFDTVMCHRNPPLTQVQVGRSFYMLNQRPFRLDDGMEIWFGYNQSVHLTERGPAVLVNFSAKAFHQSGSVIHYASDLLGQDVLKMGNWDRRSILTLGDSLKKVKIQVTHLPYRRKYSVKGVTDKPARDLPVTINGTTTTVATYFQQKYRPLRYPYLPCLSVQSSHATYIPMEVCEVCPNQPVLGKLSPATTSKMIRQTAIAPEERFRRIQGEAQKINDVSGETMNGFGLFMDIRFMQLKGRVLPAPSLTYGEGRDPVAKPDPTGKWRIDGKRFLRSLDGCSWMIISFAQERFCGMQVLERFADTLCQTARKLGMNLEEARDIRVIGRNVSTFNALKSAKEMGLTFAVVVLSSRDPIHSYEEVKFMGDVQLRLVTQCMDETVVSRKFNAQVATNVLLKINSKVGGVNHSILQRHAIFSRPVIIIGADAAHTPRGVNRPSVAAVVGSLDAYPSRYAVTCRTQRHFDEKKQSQEIIVDLEEMMKHILATFLKNTRGKYPEKVVFFRDGVSEGQFMTVLEDEVPKVQRACQEVLSGNIPPLTYLVVQKRHQTRFRPTNPKDGVGRMGNIPPGTTVDTDVVHPVNFDFFLCSHEGIQGTSKPAHYTVIYDENRFTADELQKLCFHLCHTYTRCNRSISVPAPIMYADLACQRAMKYIEFCTRSDTQSVASSGSSEERALPPEVEDAINNMSNFQPGMFFV